MIAATRRKHLSAKEVAWLFGVTASTVYRWAALGLLPAVRTPGGRWRFDEEVVRRALETGLQPQPAKPARQQALGLEHERAVESLRAMGIG